MRLEKVNDVYNVHVCLLLINCKYYQLQCIVILTRKNSKVVLLVRVPYWTSVCAAKSSGELIGVTILSMVKNAARFAV